MNAHQHLQAAIACLAERGKQYDKPEGERSMEATVDAFEAVTGHSLTVTQGWLFMVLLKAVRTQQGEYKADSFIDGAAYFALAGESAAQAAPADCGENLLCPGAWDAAEKRMDVVGQNGNDGAAYVRNAPEGADAAIIYSDGTVDYLHSEDDVGTIFIRKATTDTWIRTPHQTMQQAARGGALVWL